MRGLRHLIAVLLLLALPGIGAAQETEAEEQDKGFLTNFLEGLFTEAGREVRITNFDGALSSRATIDELTIADDEGVWLIARGLVLDWNRSEIFGGVLQVNELSADVIEIPRLPVTDDSLPPPEAGEFRVPELPVEVNIGAVVADRIVLGGSVLGRAAVLDLAGSARLADGGGRFNLQATRIDDRRGAIRLAGAYDPGGNLLSVDLLLREEADGIAANALNIPDRPALTLRLLGEGPVDDFNADLTLSTDGVERVTGTAGLTADAAGNRAGRVDITGDLTALLPARDASFFAGEARLTATGRQRADGVLALERFTLDTRYADLSGALVVDADGAVAEVSLSGRIVDSEGAPVPLPGGTTTLGAADVTFSYDRARGDDWQGQALVTDFRAPGVSVARGALSGDGQIVPEGRDNAGFTGALDLDLTGLALDDPGLARAIGTAVKGTVRLEDRPDRPFRFSALDVDAGGVGLTGSGTVAGFSAGFETGLQIGVVAPDLARLALLTGLADLGGAAEIALSGQVQPISGAFDLRIDARSDPLRVGVAEADALLAAPTALSAVIDRSVAGITLEQLNLENTSLKLSANGNLSSDGSFFEYEARLKDLADLPTPEDQPAGSGMAEVTGVVRLGPAGEGLTQASLTGTLSAGEAQAVRLPLRDTVLRMAGADLGAEYTVSSGAFSLSFAARDLAEQRGTADLVSLSLDGRAPGGFAGENPASGNLRIDATGLQLADPALAEAVGSEITATSRVAYSDRALRLSTLEAQAGDVRVTGDLTMPFGDAATRFDGRAEVARLDRFSGLVNVPLRGATEADVTVSLGAAETAITLDGTARRLGLGNAMLDPVLAGNIDYALAARQSEEMWLIDSARIAGPRLTASASGNSATGFDLEARLADLGVITPDFPGAVTAEGRVTPINGDAYGVDLRLTGPGGTVLNVDGTYATSGAGANLTARGDLPLGLLNPTIAPRRITGQAEVDLTLNGPPRLENLTGRIATGDARISAPTIAFALENIALGATFGGGRAEIAGRASGTAGGGLTVSGTVGLAALDADLEIAFNDLAYRRGDVVKTRVGGALDIDGRLTGGARIGGVLRLGETEIRVADTGLTTQGPIPPIDFIASSAAAAETRQRAGMTATSTRRASATGGTGGATRVPFELDFGIVAPNQVFVRGRGVDAELGGVLRIGGTTANPVPQGRLDLIRGRLSILAQRFDLDEGSVQVLGELDPYIRLVASTEKNGFTVSVIIEGRASEPQVSFESVPELPDDEVLALLIFGRSLSNLTAFQALELASAIATLSGRGGVGIIERLRQNFGLDDLDLTTDDEGNTAVRFGKYISDNVYTDVTVDSGGETELNLNLDLSPNLTARGGVTTDGDTSLGIFFEKDY